MPPTRQRRAFDADQRAALTGWHDLQHGIAVLPARRPPGPGPRAARRRDRVLL